MGGNLLKGLCFAIEVLKHMENLWRRLFVWIGQQFYSIWHTSMLRRLLQNMANFMEGSQCSGLFAWCLLRRRGGQTFLDWRMAQRPRRIHQVYQQWPPYLLCMWQCIKGSPLKSRISLLCTTHRVQPNKWSCIHFGLSRFVTSDEFIFDYLFLCRFRKFTHRSPNHFGSVRSFICQWSKLVHHWTWAACRGCHLAHVVKKISQVDPPSQQVI